ncbi:MAG: protein YhfH [Bacillus sp. (in: firmicutes)]
MKKQQSTQYFKIAAVKKCPECGASIHISQECYLMECDRCLSKKQES